MGGSEQAGPLTGRVPLRGRVSGDEPVEDAPQRGDHHPEERPCGRDPRTGSLSKSLAASRAQRRGASLTAKGVIGLFVCGVFTFCFVA